MNFNVKLYSTQNTEGTKNKNKMQWRLLCTWDIFHKEFMSSWFESCENSLCFDCNFNHPKSLIRTCHGSCCCDMCKVVAWSDHYFSCQSVGHVCVPFQLVQQNPQGALLQNGFSLCEGNLNVQFISVYLISRLNYTLIAFVLPLLQASGYLHVYVLCIGQSKE